MGRISLIILIFQILPTSVQYAHYHYKGVFPDQKGSFTFPYSGKYTFYITDAMDTSIVYAIGTVLCRIP